MLFVLYVILFLGGMIVTGLSFNVAGFEGPTFMLGILLISAALATPFTASAIERRGDKTQP